MKRPRQRPEGAVTTTRRLLLRTFTARPEGCGNWIADEERSHDGSQMLVSLSSSSSKATSLVTAARSALLSKSQRQLSVVARLDRAPIEIVPSAGLGVAAPRHEACIA